MGKAQLFRLKGITEKNEHDENGTEQFFKRKLNFYALLHTEVPPEETLPPTHWPSGGELADRRMGCHPPPGPCHVGVTSADVKARLGKRPPACRLHGKH